MGGDSGGVSEFSEWMHGFRKLKMLSVRQSSHEYHQSLFKEKPKLFNVKLHGTQSMC